MATIEHIRHFQEELQQLKTRLLEMGGLAEERVRLAVKGLVDVTDLIDQVLTSDEPLNALHIEIDNRCFTLLALHQPMAVDPGDRQPSRSTRTSSASVTWRSISPRRRGATPSTRRSRS